MTGSAKTSALTRRRVVGGAATVAAATALPNVLTASAASAATTTEVSGEAFVTTDPLLHLLRRGTWGPTPASIAEARQLGVAGWLNQQLSPATINDGVCDQLVARLPLAGLTIDQVHAKVNAGTLKDHAWDMMHQVGFGAVGRAVWSRRQLFEVMVDFWSNHLNVPCPEDVWDCRQDYDRAVIRQHALGRFADMLKASARHPAMLRYLDNWASTKTAPNENYGRELLELHTVGLVHTEADVKNAARVLTGLTWLWQTGRYAFNPNAHFVGPVTVLGFKHANATAAGGEAAAMAMLDYLAMHPATAKRIATKLCVRFVSDEPPATLVAKLTQVYLDNNTAIAPVLRALFTSPEFAASIGQKARTPFEDIVATVRVLGYAPEKITAANPTGTKGLQTLYVLAREAGQAPLAWPAPNGYPDVASAWSSPSGYLIRWNNHHKIATGWLPAELTRPANPVTGLIGAAPSTYGGLIDAIAKRLFSRTLKPEHTAALTAYFGKTPASVLKSTDVAVGWAFNYLVALMLNSPYFGVR